MGKKICTTYDLYTDKGEELTIDNYATFEIRPMVGDLIRLALLFNVSNSFHIKEEVKSKYQHLYCRVEFIEILPKTKENLVDMGLVLTVTSLEHLYVGVDKIKKELNK